MMAAHRTMRLRMTRGAFPLSSFSGRKEACHESTGIDRAWRYRACSGDHRALGYSRGAAVRAGRDLRTGAVDRGERPRAVPVAAVVNVVNFNLATSQIGQTTLRNVLGQSELDELLAERNKINRDLQTIIDEQTERWGVKVTAVEIKDVELPATMQRAMAKQAEAEREKRAKVIHAQGELLASTQLAQAAAVIGSQPATLQLRYLQTLTEIAVEKNSTIVFPLPLDLVAPMIQILQRHAGEPVHEPLNGSRTNEPSLTH